MGSRAFVDHALTELARSGWSPAGWGHFLADSLHRSLREALKRPGAMVELALIHLLGLTRGRRRWALASWLLTLLHLGLLGEHRDLGWANRVTLVRALLPASDMPAAQLAGLALATDVADGWLARREGETSFGAFADALADVSFWTWFALRFEPSRVLRLAALSAWAAPALAITAAYFARGGTVDRPRPVAGRYASMALQMLLAGRSVRARR